MSLLQELRDAKLECRKNSNFNSATIYSTLIAEAEKVGKDDGNRESTDAEVIKVIKKFVANITEMIDLLEKDGKDSASLRVERELYKIYLPTELNEEELKSCISEIIQSLPEVNVKFMGKVMAELKAKYAGQYDGKLASQMVKDMLYS